MKRKSEKSGNFWDKIINALWFLLVGFILMLCVLILTTTTGHCAGNENAGYFPMNQNDNNIFNQTILDYIDNNLNPTDNYTFAYIWSKSANYYGMRVVTIPKDSAHLYAEILSNGYQFQLYSDTQNASLINARLYEIRKSDNRITLNSSNGALSTFGILESSLYNSNSSYVSNFRMYTNNNTDARQVVLLYGQDEEEPITQGHATPPDEFENPYFNPNSHAQPPEEVPPQVTINNYTWNTYNPPAIDDTDIISTLKSLIYVVNYLMGWLKDNISGEFQNLLSNLSEFFDYIGQTIQYYGGLIISNIQNLITTFYNNMVSLVEDIAEKIAYISEPFDSSALTDAFEEMQIYEDYDRCGQLIDDAFGFFDDISEPNTFTIPIDLRNITILHQTQILYFDLGWINSAKTLIRAFMWMVTTFGLLYTVIDSIPDYLQGQDE